MVKKIIEHNLNFYIIEKDLFETNEIFQFRINYITSNLGKKSFYDLVKSSRLLANTNFWGCEYNSHIKDNIN